MPGYRRGGYATKKYVRKEIQKEKWSGQYISIIDLDNVVVNGGTGDYYNLIEDVYVDMIRNGIFKDAPVYTGSDDEKIGNVHLKLDYVKLHTRVSLGENETVSGISQTIRYILYRDGQTYQEVKDNGVELITDDVDGSIRYDWMFGNKFGLYWDKTKYVTSHLATGTAMAGGQVFFNKFKKLDYSDKTWLVDPDTQTDVGKIDNEKGVLLLCVVGDDPDGTNADIFGYVEIGWRVKY